jgi:(R,R)-butanediol dehydrogenase / meso-butanediol dehydrogenase / diacetyl reductase
VRAVRWHGRGDVRYERVPDAPEPGADEVRVRVAWCGICGTDVHEYLHGPFVIPTRPHPVTGVAAPVVIGHEVAGTVDAVGGGVRGLEPGQPVALDGLIPCRSCDPCRAGLPNLCRTFAHIGFSASGGGLAEALTVPAAMAVAPAGEVPLDVLALAEPVSVAVRAVGRAALQPGQELLVLGAGTIGLAVAEVGRIEHGAAVVLADTSAWRLDRAMRLGFRALRVDELRGLAGSWDVPAVFDCTGSPEAVGLAMPLVSPGGRIVVVGFPATPGRVDLAQLALREVSLVGTMSHLVTSDFPRAVRLLVSGELRAGELITDRIPLEDTVPRGLDRLAGPDGQRQIKILVSPAL